MFVLSVGLIQIGHEYFVVPRHRKSSRHFLFALPFSAPCCRHQAEPDLSVKHGGQVEPQGSSETWKKG